MDDISLICTEIEKYLLDNNITICNIELRNIKIDVCLETFDDIKFLLEKSDCKSVYLSKNIFAFPDDTEIEEILENLYDEDKDEMILILNELKSYNEKVQSFKLSINYLDMFFEFQLQTSWDDKQRKYIKLRTQSRVLKMKKSQMEYNDEFVEKAKELANDIKFKKAKNKSMREYSAYLFLTKNNYYFNDRIIDLAYAIYKFNKQDTIND